MQVGVAQTVLSLTRDPVPTATALITAVAHLPATLSGSREMQTCMPQGLHTPGTCKTLGAQLFHSLHHT